MSEKTLKKNNAPVIINDGSWSDPWEQIPAGKNRAIIVAGNGLLQLKRMRALEYTLAEAATLLSSGGPDFLESFKPYCRVTLPDRIPLDDIRRVQSFFRDVTEKEEVECAIFVLWSPIERQFQFVAPRDYEDISKTHITSVFPDVPFGYVIFARIHSHVDFGAFHSGEDDAGEKTDGFYITIGNNAKSQIPSYACSVVVDGKRFSVPPHEVIDGLDPVDYPKAWWTPVTAALERQRAEEEERQRQLAASQANRFSMVGVGAGSYGSGNGDKKKKGGRR